MWDDRFGELLRKHLPFLGLDEELAPDLDLRDHGLDSMGVVALLAGLEETYGVRFADDALELDNFATPGILWETLSRMSGAAI